MWQLEWSDLVWRYWTVTAVLLFVGIAGFALAFVAVIVLSAVQFIHFRIREGSFRAFPVQVRIAFLMFVIVSYYPPLQPLYWLPALGGTARSLFGYCLLARLVSLVPWNLRAPFGWDLIRRTVFSLPVRGSILEIPLAASPKTG